MLMAICCTKGLATSQSLLANAYNAYKFCGLHIGSSEEALRNWTLSDWSA